MRPSLSKVDDYPALLAEAWQQHLAPKTGDAPTVISTFAGCGGSSLGYSMAGFRELLAVEWDDNAVATFKLNFPEVPVYHGDIAKLSVEQVLEMTGLQPGQLDVFDGSPPCQGFSTAGKRDFGDDRNQLFREYVRLLRGLKPKAFVMENVSGMVKGKMKLIFAEILRELKASSYKVSARLLNAMYFNVPQSRQRMIFIGVREDLGIEPSHPEAESLPICVGAILPASSPRLANSERVQKLWHRLKIGQSGDELPESNGNWFGLQKVDPAKPCPTLTKGWTAGTGLLHWRECRFLSVPEMAQIGSFGLDFAFSGLPSDAVKRIGNSVPPLFMRSIASHIKAHILDHTGIQPQLIANEVKVQ